MRVLFFGTYDARRHPRVRVLQEGFAELGEEVASCNVPLGFETSARLRMLQRPWLAPVFAAKVLGTWQRLRRMSKQIPPFDAVIVGYMGHFDVHLARRLWSDAPIALDHLVSARDTALDRRISSRPLLWLLGRLDRSALRAADVSFVDTDEHLGLVPDTERGRAIVVPVGAPSEWFREPAPSVAGPMKVVFFGLYTPLQGVPVIGDAIRLLTGEEIRFTMVGRGQESDSTRAKAWDNPNVTWFDWVDPERLPGLVAEHHVCLGIFGSGQKAMRVVPNKVFQGAAAGCAIVTSDTPPQRRAFGDAALFVPPSDPQALGDALRRLARDPDELSALRQAAFRRADEAFRPAAVVAPLQERLSQQVVA